MLPRQPFSTMKSRSVFQVLFCLSCCFSADLGARVGGTEAELTQEFGEPTARAMENVMVKGKLLPSFPKLTYRSGDWEITCILVDERCAKANYDKDGVWPDEEYADKLAANAQGATWSVDEKGSRMPTVKRGWLRSDGATAVWRKNLGLTVVTPAFTAAEAAVKEQARNNVKILPKD